MAEAGTPVGGFFDQYQGEDDPLAAPSQQEGRPDDQQSQPASPPAPPERIVVQDDNAPDAIQVEYPEGETPGGDRVYAGKYRSPEELERGYAEAQAALTRASQTSSEMEQRLAAMEAQVQQQDMLFQQQLMQELQNNPELAERLQAEAALQQQLQQAVEERVGPVQQQLAQSQEVQKSLGVINWFRETHPEVVPNSPDDYELAKIVGELDLDQSDPEALEIAYESLRNPGFRSILAAQPHLIDNDEGLRFARANAQQVLQFPAGVQLPQPGRQQGGMPVAVPQQAVQQAPQQQRQVPFVERGNSGAPISGAPGQRPTQRNTGDEFDAVLEMAQRESTSPLFGGLLKKES